MVVWRLVPAAAFLGLLALVAGRWEPLYDLDRAVAARALSAGHALPAWVTSLRLVTDAGATISFLAAGVALIAVLILFRQYASAAATALCVLLIPALWGVLHQVLYRPRPVGGFLEIDSNGFPSGHTSHATALAVLAVALTRGRRGHTITVICAVTFAVLIGISRAGLLAHWASDVVGGWLLGLTVVPLVWWAVGLPRPETAIRQSTTAGTTDQP